MTNNQMIWKLFVIILCWICFSAFTKAQSEPEITNSLGMKLKLIPAGSFRMGSEKFEENEKPVHEVTISKAFYIGIYEVTQAQYLAVMGENPGKFKGPDHPADQISWNDAVKFCKMLSQKTGKTYRLPTEAEWEYACRAGTTTEFYWGDSDVGIYEWYSKNSGATTHPVGQKKPNPWGLYDMSGNVYEWVNDSYASDYYSQSPAKDPKGPETGNERVFRCGSWAYGSNDLRSAARGHGTQDHKYSNSGFRIVLEIK